MELEMARGTRDYPPEESILIQEILKTLKKNFELFGFNPLQTPIIERYETLASKYAGGSEILKETFRLTDQGNRELCLRYDLTVPFARFVAMNPHLKLPFKRYQIGPVLRDGPVTSNRFREFTQCDCDVVGTKSIVADAECVQLYLQCFAELGLDVVVRVNNRKILDAVMTSIAVPEVLRDKVLLAVDKLDKKPRKEVVEEITALGIDKKIVEKLFIFFEMKGNNNALLKNSEKLCGSRSEGIDEIRELLLYCPSENVIFVPSLVRGLSYYTGTIFEVYMKDGSIPSSIGSGGRYDKMIGSFLGKSEEFPAVGCSFGLDVILNAIRKKQKNIRKSVVQVYVIPIGISIERVWNIVCELRKNGIATDVYFAGKGVTKALAYAQAYDIPYALFVGEEEMKQKKVKLRDMKTGKEEFLTIEQVVKKAL